MTPIVIGMGAIVLAHLAITGRNTQRAGTKAWWGADQLSTALLIVACICLGIMLSRI